MKITLEVPDYSQSRGIVYKWEVDSEIEVHIENGEAIIIANKDGLISLANHFLNLAQEKIPSGYHMDFDEFNSLEAGSNMLIIQKKG